ncbi:hypothetical protein RHMOL_Rhmol05G0158400 [Rhododendron molle]|uniref:Uncharacterized protein n=1 Tax=Rhododendron molle TaxID=49168 RepID=A0ACC0NPM4_RHOML|nr:hypothetical protein RHMOL_Rhmol05G0158400 [Rhododendron molle]
MAEHSGNGSGGEVSDHPEDAEAPMETESEDQEVTEVVGVEAATPLDLSMKVAGSVMVGRSPGEANHGGDGRAPEAEPRAIEEVGAMGPSVEPVGSTSSDIVKPLADHKYDVAEHLPDEALAKLLEDNPAIGELVLKAKEERARAIAATEATERAKRERKEKEEPLRDAEAEERARAEAQGPQVKAVAEAGAMTRPAFFSGGVHTSDAIPIYSVGLCSIRTTADRVRRRDCVEGP